MVDYSIYYRRAIDPKRIANELPKFDIFVSAYNSSDRVREVFLSVKSTKKIWLIHPEYQYSELEIPEGDISIKPEHLDEVLQTTALINSLGNLDGVNLCIDITGFMRHVLIFLIAKLQYLGVKNFTALYSEPGAYARREDTAFSTTTSGRVRPIRGLAGNNNSLAQDHLIIAVGYDHKLIAEVANYKDDSRVYPIFGFPSLSADMFQQSAVSAASSGEVALGDDWVINKRFAPANDPFSTAGVLSELVTEIDRDPLSIANIYLSPLSTKVQALGFALYWLLEGRSRSRGGASILLPECTTYSRETSVGLKRLWAYTIELD